MKTKIIFLVSSLVLFTTCIKDIAGPGGCFQQDVLPVFISNCTMSGCHNSKDKRAGYDLTTYEGIIKGIKARHPLNSEIYNTIRGNNPSMPQKPYPKLSLKDINTIKLWINKGAKNTSNCQSCDSVDFTYNGRVKNIMQTWCVGCHNTGNKGGGYDLSNYTNIILSIPNNKLIGSIKHQPGFLPMPQNGGQVSACDIKAIENWIKVGYPNN